MSQDMRHILAKLEQNFLHSVDNVKRLQKIEQEYQDVFLAVENQARQVAFNDEELCHFREQAERIMLVARYLASLTRDSNALVRSAREATDVLLREDNNLFVPRSHPSLSVDQLVKKTDQTEAIPVTSMQETLNSKVLRRWFLDHVADPFPSRKTKEDLVAATNALIEGEPANDKPSTSLSNQPIDYSQCTLWFINSRRRSHWTDFYRCYAHSDKARMHRFVDCLKHEIDVEEPGPNEELEALLVCDNEGCCENDLPTRMRECRETFSQMMDWLRQITKEKVGDWMDDVIREAKVELKKERVAKRVERKRIAEVHQQRDNEEREKQRRKVELVGEQHRESLPLRRSDRTQRRKEVEQRERKEHRRMTGFHTPHRTTHSAHFTPSSADSSTWTGSDGGGLRVPSLVESEDSVRMRTASSSSSLASFNDFKRSPGSPTLHILQNSQAKNSSQEVLKPLQMDAQMPLFDPASLYTSHFGRVPSVASSPCPVLHASPVREHLEEELSGGLRSLLGRPAAACGLKLEDFSRKELPTGWESLASPSIKSSALAEQPSMSLWTHCSPSERRT